MLLSCEKPRTPIMAILFVLLWLYKHTRHGEKKPIKMESKHNCCASVCLCSYSPLCYSCIASGATCLNMNRQTVWLPWRCPAWWNTPCSRSCPLVTTGTYTHLLTARPPSCRTTPLMGDCWEVSIWERDVMSSTGMTQNTEILLCLFYQLIWGGNTEGKAWHWQHHQFDFNDTERHYASWH